MTSRPPPVATSALLEQAWNESSKLKRSLTLVRPFPPIPRTSRSSALVSCSRVLHQLPELNAVPVSAHLLTHTHTHTHAHTHTPCPAPPIHARPQMEFMKAWRAVGSVVHQWLLRRKAVQLPGLGVWSFDAFAKPVFVLSNEFCRACRAEQDTISLPATKSSGALNFAAVSAQCGVSKDLCGKALRASPSLTLCSLLLSPGRSQCLVSKALRTSPPLLFVPRPSPVLGLRASPATCSQSRLWWCVCPNRVRSPAYPFTPSVATAPSANRSIRPIGLHPPVSGCTLPSRAAPSPLLITPRSSHLASLAPHRSRCVDGGADGAEAKH